MNRNYIYVFRRLSIIDNDEIYRSEYVKESDIWDLYDLINVIFDEEMKYILYPHFIQIPEGHKNTASVENYYLTKDFRNNHPYILIRFTDGDFAYIDTRDSTIHNFESQQDVRNKLLDFLLRFM